MLRRTEKIKQSTACKKVIEVSNELKLGFVEQQDDIKHLKVQCDIHDEDEVWDITAAITPTTRTKKPLCVSYNQTFVTNKWLKSISRKITLSSGEISVAKYLEISRK